MRSHPLSRILLGILMVTAGTGACGVGANVSGQLGATAAGDLSNPPAERRDGRSDIIQACGQPPSIATPIAFARTPYLQQVTDGAADLSWVSATDASLSVAISAA